MNKQILEDAISDIQARIAEEERAIKDLHHAMAVIARIEPVLDFEPWRQRPYKPRPGLKKRPHKRKSRNAAPQ